MVAYALVVFPQTLIWTALLLSALQRINDSLASPTGLDLSGDGGSSPPPEVNPASPAENRAAVAAELGSGTVGVLDIFGFEIFARNSLEQLLINFCNVRTSKWFLMRWLAFKSPSLAALLQEKLQQHFNTHVFKRETDVYRAEGIDFSEVVFQDNANVLDTIEKAPVGVLRMLDDYGKMLQVSDRLG
jgi:hypothetical protein